MVANNKAPNINLRYFNIKPPFFDYINKYKGVSGYTGNAPTKNFLIGAWMLKEGYSCGEFSYAKGNLDTEMHATSKYAQSERAWDELIWSKAWKMVSHSWSVVNKSRLADSYYEWMDKTTSPGYPFSLVYKTKKDAYADEAIRQHCDDVFVSCNVNGIFTVRCKKEPKKLKKILANDSRVITSSPMDTQVAGIRLFAEQNSHVYNAARTHMIPCTVGLTKYYRGWHNLYQRLTRFGKFSHGIELDYTGFDGSITARELEAVANIRFGMLRAECQTADVQEAFSRYYGEMVHTKMIFGSGDVVIKHCGNPSGQVNTIVDNCIINEFRWYYTWCSIMPEEYHNLESFRLYCELITCGDDSLITVDDAIRDIFTPALIFDVFTRMNWQPKFGADGYKPIHELSYCSQNFKWMYGYVVPVPNNTPKLFASLLYGGEHRTVRETLARLLGIKIESYFLTHFRDALDLLISHLFEKYYVLLCNLPEHDTELTLPQLQILNRDYASAYGLYLGISPDSHSFGAGPVPEFSNTHIQDV